MSGPWRPYPLCIRDTIALTNYWYSIKDTPKIEEYRAQNQQMDAEEDLLIHQHGDTDWKRTDYAYQGYLVNDPGFLADYRELVTKYFKQRLGRNPLSHKPIGPNEMVKRNHENIEYDCTALYYVPAPEEDVILCNSEDCPSEHYRDKITHEEIRHAYHDAGWYKNDDGSDQKLDHSKWHAVQFVANREEHKIASEIFRKKREIKDKKAFKEAMDDLSRMSSNLYHAKLLKSAGLTVIQPTEEEIKEAITAAVSTWYKFKFQI